MGEKEVVDLIKCPNCKSKLILLPQNNPLFDVQCERCVFRAQVKTSESKPKSEILGAGWKIMDKVLKSGYQVPPLIVNFRWKGGHEIRFYPFIPRKNLRKSLREIKSANRKHWMFNYVGVDKLPCFVLYQKQQ